MSSSKKGGSSVRGILPRTSYLIQTTYNRINQSLYEGLTVIRKNSKTFWIIQIGYWSITLLSACLIYYKPQLQLNALDQTDKEIDSYKLGKMLKGWYDSDPKSTTSNFKLAALFTFIINLTIGTFGVITLPSLFIPLSGIVITMFRSYKWGQIFSPFGNKPFPESINIPHLITMLIEAQPYIIAALGDWLLTRRLYQKYKETTTKSKSNSKLAESKSNQKDETSKLKSC
ncbi:uncharacterized protein L201_002360 [Kwoniella dendrophila CBS 6074]|uniref:Uncharacterized protein n=1 Tax=Kwoniella dendrophila CBS 6074 TaxID=1295534 RepID=A0AAX4JQY0_9TREE